MYKKIAKADQLNKEGGYKNVVFFAPKDDFLAVAKPTINLTSLGGPVTITTTHTFPADKGFISFLSKKHAVTTKATSTGEDGSKSLLHTFEFILLGDSSTTLDQMRQMLNDDLIFLVKDQDCLNATDYVQFGDECLMPDITIEFDGKTTKEGLKEYKVTGSVKDKKFFYQGTITEATSYALAAPEPVSFSSVLATSLNVSMTTVAGATTYEVQRSTTTAMTSPTTTTGSGNNVAITGLTSGAAYWFRCRVSNASGVSPWTDILGITMP